MFLLDGWWITFRGPLSVPVLVFVPLLLIAGFWAARSIYGKPAPDTRRELEIERLRAEVERLKGDAPEKQRLFDMITRIFDPPHRINSMAGAADALAYVEEYLTRVTAILRSQGLITKVLPDVTNFMAHRGAREVLIFVMSDVVRVRADLIEQRNDVTKRFEAQKKLADSMIVENTRLIEQMATMQERITLLERALPKLTAEDVATVAAVVGGNRAPNPSSQSGPVIDATKR